MFNYLQTVLRGVISSRMTSEKGATAVEYGIMVAAIAVVVIVVAFTLGDEIVALFEEVSTELGTERA